MTDLKQSIREIEELIDLVITIRICQANHRKSNTALRKCAHLLGKRFNEPFVKGICKELSGSSNVVADIATLQTKLLEGK